METEEENAELTVTTAKARKFLDVAFALLQKSGLI